MNTRYLKFQDRLDFENISKSALKQAETLVPRWLQVGRREGNEWVALNPTRKDRHLGSFKINLKRGVWADFATGEKGGDLISLYAYINDLKQTQAACRVAKEIGYAD